MKDEKERPLEKLGTRPVENPYVHPVTLHPHPPPCQILANVVASTALITAAAESDTMASRVATTARAGGGAAAAALPLTPTQLNAPLRLFLMGVLLCVSCLLTCKSSQFWLRKCQFDCTFTVHSAGFVLRFQLHHPVGPVHCTGIALDTTRAAQTGQLPADHVGPVLVDSPF